LRDGNFLHRPPGNNRDSHCDVPARGKINLRHSAAHRVRFVIAIARERNARTAAAFTRETESREERSSTMNGWWSHLRRRLFSRSRAPAAYDEKEAAAARHDAAPVRSAGPEAMRDPPRRWSKVDEESDASFPASDPPANY
jgi:hypothetical protein